MKGFLFKFLCATATVIGSVVGAGFITGAEIMRFFSGASAGVVCFLLFAVACVFLFAMILQGSEYGNQKTANLCVLGRFSSVFSVFICVFCFITLSGMCAGLDAVIASIFGIDERLPTLSVPMLGLSLLLCKRGIIRKF